MSNTVLIADDDASVITALKMLLESQGFAVVAVTTPEALIEQVKLRDFCAALIDLNYQADTTSGKEGLALIEKMKQVNELLPIIVMTGYSSVEIAVDAMKLGASDFVQKPWSNEHLLHILRTQINMHDMSLRGSKLAQENALLKTQIQEPAYSFVAHSKVMQSLLVQLEKLAQSDMSILLTGENGTGKSMFAEYIHQHSTRHNEAFIGVNMGAISETLFESEMFGHVKGAFTDAKDSRIGRFELAESGTIFLDEIANISLSQQAKLLRVLEERQFEKVGSSKTQQVDVRFISATNANIESILSNNEFRQDLLYRLNTVTLHIPALRERKEDILPLSRHFLQSFASKYRVEAGVIDEEAATALEAYDWPGNIRELSHIIERALFLRTDNVVQLSDLALPNIKKVATDNSQRQWNNATLDEIEKQVIQQRLETYNSNPLKTADSLGLSRSAYYRRLEKYQLLES
jgi:DNA-binding NtrC family response regulator